MTLSKLNTSLLSILLKSWKITQPKSIFFALNGFCKFHFTPQHLCSYLTVWGVSFHNETWRLLCLSHVKNNAAKSLSLYLTDCLLVYIRLPLKNSLTLHRQRVLSFQRVTLLIILQLNLFDTTHHFCLIIP